MPYTKTAWTAGTTACSQPNMNNLETQYDEAVQSLQPVTWQPFVVSGGLVCTKNGGNPKQLDVTAGSAWLKQADNALRLRQPSGTNFATVTPSSTYQLWLQPDGTFIWGVAPSPAANSLQICQLTTDGSGNINTPITDTRTLTAVLNFGGGANPIQLGGGLRVGGAITNSAPQAYNGSFGVPFIWTQQLDLAVVATTSTNVLSTVPNSGTALLRISGSVTYNNPSNGNVLLQAQWTDPHGALSGTAYFTGVSGSGTRLLDGTVALGTSPITYALQPLTVRADTNGGFFQVVYRDSAGAPNDHVTIIVEQLA